MKSAPKPGFERLLSKQPRKADARKDEVDQRKEGLVLLAIAFLFLANVVLYLCHYYGLTS